MLTNFALLSLAEYDHFDTFPGWVGGWLSGWGKIEIKDQLSPAETETGAELGKKLGLSSELYDGFKWVSK